MKQWQDIQHALRIVFRESKYLVLFAIVSLFFFFLYLIYPVISVPGNDLAFQIAITPWWGLGLIIMLALAMGLLLAMQIFIWRRLKASSIQEGATTVVAGGAGFISNMFASASCISCVSALFGFLGSGTVILLIEYRWEIMTASMGLVAIGLYFTSKRINGKCETC